MSDTNGSNGGKVYVPFGRGETDEMPLEWAAEMLTKWREKKPVEFGRTLAEVVTGVAPKGR